MSCQRRDFFRHASMMLEHVQRLTTGRICRKSQQKRIGSPPNTAEFSLMSFSVKSTASNSARWVIGASSTIRSFASSRTGARAVPFLIAHVGVSWLCASRGSLNVECNVLPSCSSVTAILLDAIPSAMLVGNMILASIKLMRNLTPGACTTRSVYENKSRHLLLHSV